MYNSQFLQKFGSAVFHSIFTLVKRTFQSSRPPVDIGTKYFVLIRNRKFVSSVVVTYTRIGSCDCVIDSVVRHMMTYVCRSVHRCGRMQNVIESVAISSDRLVHCRQPTNQKEVRWFHRPRTTSVFQALCFCVFSRRLLELRSLPQLGMWISSRLPSIPDSNFSVSVANSLLETAASVMFWRGNNLFDWCTVVCRRVFRNWITLPQHQLNCWPAWRRWYKLRQLSKLTYFDRWDVNFNPMCTGISYVIPSWLQSWRHIVSLIASSSGQTILLARLRLWRHYPKILKFTFTLRFKIYFSLPVVRFGFGFAVVFVVDYDVDWIRLVLPGSPDSFRSSILILVVAWLKIPMIDWCETSVCSRNLNTEWRERIIIDDVIVVRV